MLAIFIIGGALISLCIYGLVSDIRAGRTPPRSSYNPELANHLDPIVRELKKLNDRTRL